jgi:flagellar hook protein FlgE
MSLYGALISGISGLSANSQAMGVISDNIANVNTIGYKGTVSKFSTLVAGKSEAGYMPGGVQSKPKMLVDQQGILQTSNSPTDLALSGNGFFVVSPSPTSTEKVFTRAGSFTTDKSGNLVNAAGYVLQGVAADATGKFPPGVANLGVLTNVNIASLSGAPVATASIGISANLRASQPVNPGAASYAAGDMASKANGGAGILPDFERSVIVYDSLGATKTLNLAFLKAPAANTWRVEVYSVPAAATTGSDGLVASGSVVFDGQGALASTTLPATFNINWATSGSPFAPTSPQAVSLDVGTVGKRDGLGQVETPSILNRTTVDGAGAGSLANIAIDNDGVVSASFTNGTTRPVYRLALATFTNPNGLASKTGNVFEESLESGDATLKYANASGAASVTASSLEASTVDLAKEFSDMIVTQRAYSASSKIITTADEMLDELLRIKR